MPRHVQEPKGQGLWPPEGSPTSICAEKTSSLAGIEEKSTIIKTARQSTSLHMDKGRPKHIWQDVIPLSKAAPATAFHRSLTMPSTATTNEIP